MSSPRSYKITVVGRESAGKTSLCYRLINKEFFEHQEHTIGGQYFNLQDEKHIHKDVKLAIWDTAGSERYASLLAWYNRGANCVLFVFDPTEPYDKQIQYFDTHLQKDRDLYPQDAKCYALITKSDKTPDDKNDEKQINKFKEDRGIKTETIVCSAKNKDDPGIRKLKDTLIADSHPHKKLEIKNNQPDLLDLPKATPVIAAFMKIYKAMRDGESSWFRKTNFLDSIDQKELNDSGKLYNRINEYAEKNTNSRTAKAWALALKHNNDTSPNNTELFKEIYKWSFEHSGLFKKSNVVPGTFFLRSASLEPRLKDMEIDEKKLENAGTRSGKIYRALKGNN